MLEAPVVEAPRRFGERKSLTEAFKLKVTG